MEKAVVFTDVRKAGFEEYESPKLKADEVRTKTLFSAISHGTEMNVYRGTAPYYNKKFDLEKRLFLSTKGAEWTYPIRYGYENVGEVIEAGKKVSHLKKGDIVASYSRHQTEVALPEKEAFKLPEELAPELGIFFATTSIAFNGILGARLNIGETIVIFGQGVIGLIAVQLAKLSGAGCVVAVDMLDNRLDMAKKFGADMVINPAKCDDVALKIREITEGRGADLALEISGSDKALHEAVRCVSPHSTVIAMSWYPGGAGNLFLGEEFHHNWINIQCSQTCAIPPELSARWTVERRNKVVLGLLPKLRLKELVTNTFDFNEADKAYEMVDKHPEKIIQVMLRY